MELNIALRNTDTQIQTYAQDNCTRICAYAKKEASTNRKERRHFVLVIKQLKKLKNKWRIWRYRSKQSFRRVNWLMQINVSSYIVFGLKISSYKLEVDQLYFHHRRYVFHSLFIDICFLAKFSCSKNTIMKYFALLLCIAVGYIHSWTIDYLPAKQVSSPHFNRGRSGQAITCK